MIQCEKLQGVVSLSALLCERPQLTLLVLSFSSVSLGPVNKLFQSNGFLFSIIYTNWLQTPGKPCTQKLLLVLLFYFILLKVISTDVHPLNFLSFTFLVRVPLFPVSDHLAKNRFQVAS